VRGRRPKPALLTITAPVRARCFGRCRLLIYLKASSWFTRSVRVVTSSDEKPNQDKDPAKTKLSHSTEIRPPPSFPSELLGGVGGARCKPSLPSSIIVQVCRS
jgi:hypothetical protein